MQIQHDPDFLYDAGILAIWPQVRAKLHTFSLRMRETAKFPHSIKHLTSSSCSKIGVGEHDDDVRFLIESRNLALTCGQIAKIPSCYEKSGSHNMTESRNVGVSRVRNEKICNLALIYGRIAEIPASYRKSVSANMMVMSDF